MGENSQSSFVSEASPISAGGTPVAGMGGLDPRGVAIEICARPHPISLPPWGRAGLHQQISPRFKSFNNTPCPLFASFLGKAIPENIPSFALDCFLRRNVDEHIHFWHDSSGNTSGLRTPFRSWLSVYIRGETSPLKSGGGE